MKKVNKLKKKGANDQDQKDDKQTTSENGKLTGSLEKDYKIIKKRLGQALDVVYREFEIKATKQKGYLIFLEGFIDKALIDVDVLRPLLIYSIEQKNQLIMTKKDIKDFIQRQLITAAQVKSGQKIQDVLDHILSGETALLVDGIDEAFFIKAISLNQRSVEQPETERAIRGPKDAFTESIKTNVSLVRRRLKTPQLKLENKKVGQLSQTTVVITYLDTIANPSIVEEVHKRIDRIKIDAVEEGGSIEELIEDNAFSVFPQVLYTERPDKLVASLLEGKVGIIVENTPFALVVPVTFFDMMTASEDYYERFVLATAVRMLRYLYLLAALLFPSLYIAIVTFHLEMLPTNLVFSVAASRENVPFPALVEALLMEISFEGLREAGIRLPTPAGQAISIVGALVIGEAAVQAGIVSAPLVIVVATTGIASFIFPNYALSASVRLLRFPMMILAGTLGLYGILLGVFFILIHLSRLRSFGIPYLSAVAPFHFRDLKDVFIRAPWWAMINRPDEFGKNNGQRMKKFLRPRIPRRYP
ncbi:spore germination protein [Scopulibacillus cellulosilyticus]|uniref:Spore germination protein n=1 Tax=Scopulibacillus cellulosilyticus TaxID=2665665 RepID=A0ABW2PRU3_9BACL